MKQSIVIAGPFPKPTHCNEWQPGAVYLGPMSKSRFVEEHKPLLAWLMPFSLDIGFRLRDDLKLWLDGEASETTIETKKHRAGYSLAMTFSSEAALVVFALRWGAAVPCRR